MNSRKKINFILYLFLFISILIPSTISYGASATMNLASDSLEVTEGDTFMVQVEITSESNLGGVEAYIYYDEDILEYDMGSSVITGGAGVIKILDNDIVETTTYRKYAMKFKALKNGVCNFSIQNAVVYDYDDNNAMSLSTNQISIKVVAPETASTDAKLQTLLVAPGELIPEFSQDVYEYNITIGNEYNKLIISAIPADGAAKVSVTGNENLTVGENKIDIKVTAEAGNTEEYTIHVLREDVEEDKENTDQEDTDTEDMDKEEDITEEEIKELEVEKTPEGTLIKNMTEHILVELADESILPEGYVKSTLLLDGVAVTVYDNPASSNRDFVLIYGKEKNGVAQFYQYDKKEKTIQRCNVITEGDIETTVTFGTYDLVKNAEYKSNIAKLKIVILGLTILSIGLGITLIVQHVKSKVKDRD